jgi:hypothetical protein
MADNTAACTAAAHVACAAAACPCPDDGAARGAAAAELPPEWRPDPEVDLVLSDVHIGRAPSAAQRCTTVFCFRPGWAPVSSNGDGVARAPCSCASEMGGFGTCVVRDGKRTAADALASGAAGAELDEDGDVLVKRRRTAHGAAAGAADSRVDGAAADGFVIHHAMATSLHDVGKQVSLQCFLRG